MPRPRPSKNSGLGLHARASVEFVGLAGNATPAGTVADVAIRRADLSRARASVKPAEPLGVYCSRCRQRTLPINGCCPWCETPIDAAGRQA